MNQLPPPRIANFSSKKKGGSTTSIFCKNLQNRPPILQPLCITFIPNCIWFDVLNFQRNQPRQKEQFPVVLYTEKQQQQQQQQICELAHQSLDNSSNAAYPSTFYVAATHMSYSAKFWIKQPRTLHIFDDDYTKTILKANQLVNHKPIC